MGNPHAIFWVDQDVWTYDMERFGPLLENHPIFPERANISVAHATSRHAITLRTWERGAGLTRACGSAACAAAVSAVRTGRTDRTVTVTVPGGPLLIEWLENDHVMMHLRPNGSFRDPSIRKPALGSAMKRHRREPPDGSGRRYLRLPPQHLQPDPR